MPFERSRELSVSKPESKTRNPEKGYVALLGWSLNAIEAVDRFDRRYLVVAPDWAEDYCKEHGIPYVPWNFERLNDRSMEIAETLKEKGVDVAIPLFEETVEWAGAINSVLLDNPRLFGQSLLLRDKALMKRRAQLGGIRVGIFEEAHERDDVIRFLKRVNQTLLKLDGDPNDPIHLKAFDKAGSLGHRVIRTPDEVDTIPDEEFPVLMESHLDGWEFAVEAWIHNGKIRFLNISEYVTLGYSVFVPATPELERYRPEITRQIEKLIKTFDIEFGFVHPEYYGGVLQPHSDRGGALPRGRGGGPRPPRRVVGGMLMAGMGLMQRLLGQGRFEPIHVVADVSAASEANREEIPVEQVVALLRERVYGAMTCLATLAVLVRYTAPETSPWSRVLDVAVATGGLWAASLLADWVAHLGAHHSAPRGRAALRMLQASGQIVEAAVLPLLILVAAAVGLLSLSTAMWIAMWILVVELGVIALFAVRMAQLRWWQKLFTIAGLVGVGVLVVGIKILGH
ncbi:hypothetical protein [Rhodococcus jostii]